MARNGGAEAGGAALAAGAARLRWSIAGAALLVSAALLGAAHVVASPGDVPILLWLAGGAGALCLLRGVWR